jgi:O-antigen/teichoic acid export membrane protein
VTEVARQVRDLSPRGRLGFLARDAMLYGGAAAINALFGIITFPLLARHFDVAEYGLIDLLAAVSALLAVVVVFGQDSAVARFYYGVQDDVARRAVVSESAYIQLITLFATLAILLLNLDAFLGWLGLRRQDAALLGVVLLTAPVQLATNFAMNLLKWTFERRRFLVLSVGSVAARMAAIIVAIRFFDLSVFGLFALTLCVHAAFAAYGLVCIRWHLQLVVDGRHVAQLLRFGLPLGVIGVAAAAAPAVERVAISTIAGATQLGLYAAGAKIALLLSLFVQAFQTAWGPFSLALHDQVDSERTFDLVLRSLALVAICGAMMLHVLGDVLVELLASDRYAGAAVVVFPLAMTLAIQGVGWVLELGITVSKRSYLSLVSYATGLIVLVTLIWPVVERFGAIGAASVVLLSQIVRTCLSAALGQSVWRRAWSYGRTAGAFALAMVAWLAVDQSGVAARMPMWLEPVAFAGVALGLVFVLFTSGEREQLVAYSRAGWARLVARGG